jgi:quinoprotein glucose dehydrogenase
MRAFDVDNGDELWTYKMPAGLSGLPAIYEAQGREYLVVGSGPPPVFGLRRGGRLTSFAEDAASASQTNLGYVVFALPKKEQQPQEKSPAGR